MISAVVIAAALLPASQAQPGPDTGMVAVPADAQVVGMSWAAPPTPGPDDYPPMAVLLGASGTVVVRCMAEVDGSVSECEAVESAPQGWGFEAAAVRVINRGRVNPRTVNGVPERVAFQVRIPFLMGDLEPVPAYRGPEPAAEDQAVFRDLIAFSAGPESFYCINLYDFSPEQRAAVMPILRQVFEEHRAEWVDATGLAFARLSPPGAAQALREGRAPQGPDRNRPLDVSAFDRAEAVEQRIFAHARVLYCARYDCPSI